MLPARIAIVYLALDACVKRLGKIHLYLLSQLSPFLRTLTSNTKKTGV